MKLPPELASSEEEIRINALRFRQDAEQAPLIVERAVFEANLWTVDPVSMSFGPTRFVAYCGWSTSQLVNRRAQLNAPAARRTVERLVRYSHECDDALGKPIQRLLTRWIYMTFGHLTRHMAEGFRDYRFVHLSVPIPPAGDLQEGDSHRAREAGLAEDSRPCVRGRA